MVSWAIPFYLNQNELGVFSKINEGVWNPRKELASGKGQKFGRYVMYGTYIVPYTLYMSTHLPKICFPLESRPDVRGRTGGKQN